MRSAASPGFAPVPFARLLLLILCGACRCHAQELEPRAYSPSPVGTHFFVLAAGRSTGGVLFDPSLPYTDVHARLSAGAAGYGQTFGLFNHSASVALAVPYVRGSASGNVGEDTREVHRSGLADASLRLSVNLIGGPALTPAQFARRTPRTTLGASLTVVAPVGQYDPARLINIGANRWALKPELGLSHPIDRWYLEVYAGVWLFTDNTEFRGDNRREQRPIATFQAHASYTIRPRLWLALDATYYAGGRTTVNGTHKADRQENSRVGLTLSVPAASHQSLKFSWSEGATTRIGGDFRTLGLAWQYIWLASRN